MFVNPPIQPAPKRHLQTNALAQRLGLLCSAVSLASCASMSVDAPSALAQANVAMGGGNVKSLQFEGTGTAGIFGQAYQPGMAWPKVKVSSFSRTMDYEGAAMRLDQAISRAEPTGGGALPLMGTGEQRSTALLKGDKAWNMAGPAPAASPLAVAGRVHDLWTSPHGVIKAALKNGATAKMVEVDGRPMTAVSFAQAGIFTATAYLNKDNQVERVDSVQPNPVMGDTATTTWYQFYKNFDGVQFPLSIRQEMGGYEVLDLNVVDVKVNGAPAIEVPALVNAFAERVASDKVADGLWFLGGGSHHSVLIEMADHLMLVESPLYDDRASAVLAEVKKLSNKPLKYVINSHHHFDHAGGLRAAVAEGVEIIASAQARPYLERILANGNSIAPDALQKSGKRATVSGVDGKRVFSDASRTVEVYFIQDSVHAAGFNMVYLPKEKMLIEADAYTPGAPNASTPALINGNNLNLVQNLDRLKLAVERILPLHGRVVPLTELYTAVGRK